MKLLSLFSGIGAFEKALENLGIKYELVNYCEIDKYASLSYSLIHNVSESKNLGDITKVDTSKFPKDIDLVTYGFPCQDISLAGKQQGFQKDDGSTTRSGLFFEALRIIEDTKPRIAIAENVKNLVSKKFNKEFNIVLSSLDKAGYNSYFEVLNSKDFGIPQNRERVFIVSIRKDIDKFNFFEPFIFPRKQELKLRLKDLLESQVDEKYYLSDNLISRIVDWKAQKKPLEKVLGSKSISPTLTARGAGKEHSGMILYSDNLENTTDLQNECLSIKEKTKKGYALATDGDGVYINRPHQKRGVVQKGMIQTIKANPDVGVVVGSTQKNAYVGTTEGLSPTLTEAMGKGGGHVPMVSEKGSSYLINFGSKGKLQYNEGVSCTLLADMGTGGGNASLVKDKVGNVIPLYKETKSLKETIKANPDIGVVVNAEIKPKLVGGIGDKKSNGGSQYYQQDRIYDSESIAMAHPANLPGGSYKYLDKEQLRIRKLTPKECFRLMGFSDDDFEKVNGKVSDTQLYKQAGNSIVVNVLMALFKRLQDEGFI